MSIIYKNQSFEWISIILYLFHYTVDYILLL